MQQLTKSSIAADGQRLTAGELRASQRSLDFVLTSDANSQLLRWKNVVYSL